MQSRGSTVIICVTATDADKDELSYSYEVNGGSISGSGASVAWAMPNGEGSYTVNALTTQINGSASFPAGTSGDLANAKVSIYTSYDNWNQNNPLQFVAATGNGSNISFTISDMPAGVYYLDVWKDVDNSGGWSYGDYVGWYGNGGLGSPSLTEISILEGETKNLSISMMIINGKMMQNIKQIQ